jgi:hypothetical protein
MEYGDDDVVKENDFASLVENFETLVLSGFNGIQDLDTTEKPRLEKAVGAINKLAKVVKKGRDQS